MKIDGGWAGSQQAELLAAIDEGRVPGAEWKHHVTAYKFPWCWHHTRDSIAMALRDSAWMAESIAHAGGPRESVLYGHWERLRAAESKQRFDQLLMGVRALAELAECWIEFVELPDCVQPATEHDLTQPSASGGEQPPPGLSELPRSIGETKASTS